MSRPALVGYAEVPEFHVELARRDDPGLGERSLVIGGDPAKRGKVVSASAELRGLGIVAGMATEEALAKAPDAQWLRTDVARAREASGALRAALREEVEAIETEGLAGFYMHVPRTREEILALAARIEGRVLERTGLPLRFGAAPARFAARLAAEEAGRSGVAVVMPDDFEAWLSRQRLDRLPGVGPKTAARLAELGAVDVPGLRQIGLERLDVLLGNHGRALWMLACGEDERPLRVKRRPDSLSREETLEEGAGDRAGIAAAIDRLAALLEGALRRDGLLAGRIAIRLSGGTARPITRSAVLGEGTAEAADLAAGARALLDQHVADGAPVRRLALIVRGLEAGGEASRQLDLFMPEGPGA